MRWWSVVWMVGCGDYGPKGGRDRDDVDEAPPAFDCYADPPTCDAGSEFCLESWQGSVAMSGACAPKDGCGDCDCVLAGDIEQVWFDVVSNTNNCSGATLYCEQSDDRIWVICQK